MKKITPMVRQYMNIKQKHPDSILLFRLGDFYEMFYEDAVKASEILQIALTRRNKSDPDQLMCGIPYHASENYISKLTKAGEKVAICEQMTKPDGKGIVERDVVRIITPGTTFDDLVLDNKENNFLSGIIIENNVFAIAYCDLTTGDFFTNSYETINKVLDNISLISPKECLVRSSDSNTNKALIDYLKKRNIFVFEHNFNQNAEDYLKEEFNVLSLSVFGLKNNEMIKASAFLYSYLKETQKTKLSHIRKISLQKNFKKVEINETTIRNLELFYSSNGDKKISLFSVLDNCKTSMGSRKLRYEMTFPLCEKPEIDERLDMVNRYYEDSCLLLDTQKALSQISDVERLIGKISIGTANARDVISLRESISVFPILNSLNINQEKLLLDELSDLYQYLNNAISDEVPLSIREGGVIRAGFNEELDKLRAILYEGKDYILKMQKREIERSGINNLKIKFNKVFGYYIEISKGNLRNVPEDYIRKQTLVNAERFITPELKEYEEKVLSASDKIKELEFNLFYEVRMQILNYLKEIQKNAKIIAGIDLFSCFAFNAKKYKYYKPEITEDGIIEIEAGRHPVVEYLKNFNDFVPNDLSLNKELGFLLITGPNMGGKSTFLKQNAIIVLMAQMGSFVPCKSAKISVVDKLFCRVGASDNLSLGESTFMVEMQEASYILNNATEKSLIILDEIGRGTSTFDGLSIAWAISEYLCNKIKAKTLFATHYHELTDLIDSIAFAKNCSVKVLENSDKSVVFLYKIISGAINRSYGIEVAKLSGLPYEIIDRAYEVLDELEKKKIEKGNFKKTYDEIQLSMFTQEREKGEMLKRKLLKIDVNSLTPIQALNELNAIIQSSKKFDKN